MAPTRCARRSRASRSHHGEVHTLTVVEAADGRAPFRRHLYAASRPRRPPRREDPVLVLTRRANQSIMIGHDIVVTVLEVRGDQVRLGIRAPRSIDVHREEVFANLQQANQAAARSARDLSGREGAVPEPPATTAATDT